MDLKLDLVTYTLTPHPKIEKILLSGGGGGKIILWDIEKGVVLRKFVETAIYAMDPYVYSNVFDGKFSPDGFKFAVSTTQGGISIYSLGSDE